ncbi:MAG: polyketide synthase dehydratase domain-containing protein [Pseudomonadota bacterium]
MADTPSKSPAPMAPAPRLPRSDWTPAQLPPPPDVLEKSAPAVAGARAPLRAVSPRGSSDGSVFSNAASVHSQFIEACGQMQARYLSVMSGEFTASPANEVAAPLAPAPRLGDAALAQWMDVRGDELYIDVEQAPWLKDHCPDYGVAVVPMMGVAEIFAATAQEACPGLKVVNIRDLSLTRWIVVTAEPLRIRREVERKGDRLVHIKLYIWREAKRSEFSRDEVVASGDVILAEEYPSPPPPPPPLADPVVSPDPYESAALFHGVSFQLLSDLCSSSDGAGGRIVYAGPAGLTGTVHPIALDAGLHTGADRRWAEWCEGASTETGVCLPLKLTDLAFYGPTPRSGEGRAEMRGEGLGDGARFPRVQISLSVGDQIWARIAMTFVATPFGPMDAFSLLDRRRYLQDRIYLPDVHISTFAGEATILTDTTVSAANWIPETVETSFNILKTADVTMMAAQKEHAARALKVHPAYIQINGDTACIESDPSRAVKAVASREGRRVTVMSD